MDKPESCETCPRYSGVRCVASNPAYAKDIPTVLFVYSQPEKVDAAVYEPGSTGPTASTINHALQHVMSLNKDYQKFHIRKTYAAQCIPDEDDEKPSAKALAACLPRLQDVIAETQPVLIVAFGAHALKQLVGNKVKHGAVRGRVLEPGFEGLPCPMVVTFSEKALVVAAGLFTTFKQDLRNGLNRVLNGTAVDKTLEDISKDYRNPTTIDEALELCSYIENYAGPGGKPESWLIAVDTETTSLRPEKDTAKIIAFCFSWGTGLAGTILFDHPYAPREYTERLPELEVAIRRLLACSKPKTLHNAKFDLKFIECKYKMPVNNVAWCTLLGEHLLDEDKKGNYGLKALTCVWLPHFGGYEDRLHDLLEANEQGIFEVLDEKIEAVIAVAGPEHAPYVQALRDHRDELERYEVLKVEHADMQREYDAALLKYSLQKEKLKRDVTAWENLPRRPKKPEKPKKLPAKDATEESDAAYAQALLVYDLALTVWASWPEKPPKPTKDFAKPEKPEKLRSAPKEPKDPRSKKEIDYSTDGHYEDVPLMDLQVYGSVDADVTRQLTGLQAARLNQEAYLSAVGAVIAAERVSLDVAKARVTKAGRPKSRTMGLMRSHAIPASRALGSVEYHGISVDLAYAEELQGKLTKVIDDTRTALYDMARPAWLEDKELNLNSGPQLAKLLYDYGWRHPDGTRIETIECLKETKTGRSTAEDALKPYIKYDAQFVDGKTKYVPQRESLFLDTLFLHKKALKARDTFLKTMKILSKRDARVHCSYNLNGTGTGRSSCSDPNLQQVPKKLAGLSIKKLFITDDRESLFFVNADYKGAEVRVFTAYARDEALIKALNEGLDMHSFFASKVFGRPYEDYQARDKEESGLSKEYRALLDLERTRIKRFVFGILYGAQPKKLSQTIGCTEEEAFKLQALLFEMFPAIKEYIDEVNHLVVRDGYVETLFGRRRRFPLAVSTRHRLRAQRQACNFKIQSTSSDIVIGQLIEMHEMINSDKTWPEWGIHQPLHTMGVRILLTVHDSIGLQWPKKIARALIPWLTYYGEERVREKYPWLPVPFKIDIEAGENYGECKPATKYIEDLPHNDVEEGTIEEAELLTELREDAFKAAS